ncbi:glutamyl-tRNA synthetase [Aeromonas dhakensis]
MPPSVWGNLSPAIDAVMALVGKERVLARIDRALAYIEARMAAE